MIECISKGNLVNLSKIYLVEIDEEKSEKILELFEELKNPAKPDMYIPRY